jgi:hypothetical protein
MLGDDCSLATATIIACSNSKSSNDYDKVIKKAAFNFTMYNDTNTNQSHQSRGTCSGSS